MKPSITLCPTCGSPIEQQPKGATRIRHVECAEFETRKAQIAEAAGQITWGSHHKLKRERGNLVSIINQNMHYSKGQNLPDSPPRPTRRKRREKTNCPQGIGVEDDASSNPNTRPQLLKIAA